MCPEYETEGAECRETQRTARKRESARAYVRLRERKRERERETERGKRERDREREMEKEREREKRTPNAEQSSHGARSETVQRKAPQVAVAPIDVALL